MANGRNVPSRAFNLLQMTLDDRRRFLDHENLCLDTSLTTLGVEIVILWKLILFDLFLTKNHRNMDVNLSKSKNDARNGICTPKLVENHVLHAFLAQT